MAETDLNVHVALENRSYDIVITTGTLASSGGFVSQWWDARHPGAGGVRRALVVTDANVRELHATTVADSLEAAGWQQTLVAVTPGEESKRVASLESLFDSLVELPADRRTVVVAVGGGVVGDLAGFAAATFARGIPFVQVPTTLLAQVDSSVGGKTGVNHPQGKNLIGAFHQPLGVFIDTTTLDTLPAREYRAGLAEVIKYGAIMDAPFLDWLEENVDELNQRDPAVLRSVVARCCQLKADVVAEDEHETTGRRAILNYGHTFAHAFEALAGYQQLLHGEAVSVGMVCATQLGAKLGRVDGEYAERLTTLLAAVGLPVELPPECEFAPDEVIERMQLDKKTVGGQLRFVLPTSPGHVELVDGVPRDAVLSVL